MSVPVVVLLGQREPAPPGSGLRQDRATTSLLKSRGVKSSRVEGKRTALWCRRSAEFLSESDEKPFRPADVAEPIRVFILDYFAYELRAALAEPFKRLVDVVHGEHDAEVA
jgi:hypothetical protein